MKATKSKQLNPLELKNNPDINCGLLVLKARWRILLLELPKGHASISELDKAVILLTTLYIFPLCHSAKLVIQPHQGKKKKGILPLTIYSFVATNSTVPLHSSGLSSASLRLPSGPRLQW